MLNNLIDRIKLPFRKDKELFLSLHRITGIWPHHIEYYKIALLHSSIARRNEKGKPMNNERLEFLGDAVLDAVVGDIVFRHFPGKREGFLTTTRSKLVQRETLNHLAKEMGINKLILSSGHQSGHNSNMAGNAFEALVGAIYLDKGYDACMRFMERQILGEMINIDKLAYKEVNFKSKLIEWCQKNRVQLNFKLLGNETSEEGAPVFHFVVMLEDVEGCDARGYSKKESQQKASKDTLRKLRKDTKFLDRVFASKENRTKMEEEPVGLVPSVDETDSFIVGDKPKEDRKHVSPFQEEVFREQPAPADRRRKRTEKRAEDSEEAIQISHDGQDQKDGERQAMPLHSADAEGPARQPDREDIIAMAEAEAFKS